MCPHSLLIILMLISHGKSLDTASEVFQQGPHLNLADTTPDGPFNCSLQFEFNQPYDGAIVGTTFPLSISVLFADKDRESFGLIKDDIDICFRLDDQEPACFPLSTFKTPHLSGLVYGVHTLQGWLSLKGSAMQGMEMEKFIEFHVVNMTEYMAESSRNWCAHHPTCEGGWALQQIDKVSRALVEKENAAWFGRLQGQVERIYTAVSPGEPRHWRRFDVFMPAVQVCPTLRRIGGDGDGGKFICGLDQISEDKQIDKPCIIYSIGSDNNWSFEEDIYRSTSCNVWTFDCTVEGVVPEAIRDRVFYHDVCLGSPREGSDRYMPLKQIMAMLGHDHVTLLKADIEGYEFGMFEELLNEEGLELPEQISFELHYHTIEPGLDWRDRTITTSEIALLATRLYMAGYRVISREDNVLCPHCAEFTMLRFLCP